MGIANKTTEEAQRWIASLDAVDIVAESDDVIVGFTMLTMSGDAPAAQTKGWTETSKTGQSKRQP
jgi:hypothetical protein